MDDLISLSMLSPTKLIDLAKRSLCSAPIDTTHSDATRYTVTLYIQTMHSLFKRYHGVIMEVASSAHSVLGFGFQNADSHWHACQLVMLLRRAFYKLHIIFRGCECFNVNYLPRVEFPQRLNLRFNSVGRSIPAFRSRHFFSGYP